MNPLSGAATNSMTTRHDCSPARPKAPLSAMEEGLSGRRGKTKKKLGLPETMRIDEIAGKNERDKKKEKERKNV